VNDIARLRLASPLLMRPAARTSSGRRKETVMSSSKMFKVMCPMEGRNGTKWWMKMGTGFRNRDESINVYLDAIPNKPGFHLQLREITEEELRESSERRAAFTTSRGAAPESGPALGAGTGDAFTSHQPPF
jgi:hypothetical protein